MFVYVLEGRVEHVGVQVFNLHVTLYFAFINLDYKPWPRLFCSNFGKRVFSYN